MAKPLINCVSWRAIFQCQSAIPGQKEGRPRILRANYGELKLYNYRNLGLDLSEDIL